MNPVFNEYIEFLKGNGVKHDIKFGYYWLDRQIVRAYDKQGNRHNILRVYTDDNLNITHKIYKNKDFEMESWEDTINRNIERLKTIEYKSKELIRKSFKKYDDYTPIVLTSTGKDSEVTRHLVNEIIKEGFQDKKPIVLFNNTSMDCAHTYKMAKSIEDIKILNPEKGFYNMVKLHGTPSRHSRWCCSIFKEGTTKDYLDKNKKYMFFYGVRNEESPSRADREDETYNPQWGDREWIGILPIREWTEEEVWLYTLWKGIEINHKYKQGYARCGCHIACPFYAKSTWILDRYWYPKAYERWHRILEEDFIKGKKWVRLNCTLDEYHTCWNGGLKRKEPNEEVVKEFAEHKGIDFEVAKAFFNRNCEVCGKKVNKQDEIAMNLKFRGRDTEVFLCKKHFMERLNIDSEIWDTYVRRFKENECSLF